METPVICIVGLGYVGLPLAHAFAETGQNVIGFDIDTKRIEQLKAGHDRTGELSSEQLHAVQIRFDTDPRVINEADVVIVALPTPVDAANKPDLSILEAGSCTVGAHLKRGSIVVFESTVYPGVTEEICGPILEQASGMKCGADFTLGYSPERINPGDKDHTVRSIIKIVAGQDARTTDTLCALYGSIVRAGIHRAASIRVAEMAKAIENAQRDINIAYMNEIAVLCHRMGLQTKDVLDAARTKWNFLPFTPGLVGGHCIGVDPYYLVEKARMLGMDTHLITAGRAVNDGLATEVVRQITERLPTAPAESRVLLLGVTFKEDVPDTRNSKVWDVAAKLRALGMDVYAHDPLLSAEGLSSMGWKAATLQDGPFDAALLLVAHSAYRNMGNEPFIEAVRKGGVLYDAKWVLDAAAVEASGRLYVSL